MAAGHRFFAFPSTRPPTIASWRCADPVGLLHPDVRAEVHPKVSLIFSLEPVFAALFAWTLGGELFSPARAAGGGLIVAAMMAGAISQPDLLKGRKKEVLPS